MKPKFYVFLDIDGTMWDMKDLKNRNRYLIEMNPESGKALTILMDSLNAQYDADLVITSRRRIDWQDCLNFFYSAGYDIDKYNPHMTHLKCVNKPRGVKIAEYMYNSEKGHTEKNQRYFLRLFEKPLARKLGQKMTKRFVVIDDDMRPIKGILPDDNLIHTSKLIQSLNIEMVENFLKRNDIEILKNNHSECANSELEISKNSLKQEIEKETNDNENEMGAE